MAVLIDPAEAAEELRVRLEAVRSESFHAADVECVAMCGDPAQSIADFVKGNGIDLVMMPTHGYGTFRRLLLGSVTAKVLHDIACPVWTATHTPDAAQPGQSDCRPAVCAVDGGPESVALMRWAGAFAAKVGASLRFVHVVPGMQGFPSHHMDAEFQERLREIGTHTMKELQQASDCQAPFSVVAGSAVERVCEEASRQHADLLIIGRGAIQESRGRLFAHAYGMIRESPCPVLSV